MPTKREIIDIDSSPEVLKFIRKASKDGRPKTLRANGKEVGDACTPPINGGTQRQTVASKREGAASKAKDRDHHEG